MAPFHGPPAVACRGITDLFFPKQTTLLRMAEPCLFFRSQHKGIYRMIALLLLFALTVSGSLFAAAVFGRRFEETLPVSVGGIPVVLFLAGLLFGLRAAFLTVLVLCAALILFSLYWIIRKKSLKALVNTFLTPGFVLYGILFLFLVYIHYGRPANAFDEFSHWIDTVRAMVAADDFGTAAGAKTLFASYPPGVSLMQYFFQKTWQLFSRGAAFQEWLCYPAYQLLAFSFFFPLLKRVTWKKLLPTAVLFLLTCLSARSLFEYAITTCYIDAFLGIAFGAGFAILFTQEKEDRMADISLGVILFALVMAKDSGLFPAVVLALAMVLRRFILADKPKRLLPLAGCTAFAALCVALPKILWKIHYTGRGVAKRFAQPIDLGVLFNVLLGRETGWRKTSLGVYVQALFTTPQKVGSTGISVTWPVLFLLLALLLAVVWILAGKQQSPDGKQKTVRKTLLVTAAVSTVVYSFGLWVIYLFKFGESGAMNLLSMDRYLLVPYLAMLLFGLLLLLDWYQGYAGRQLPVFLALCIALSAILPANAAYGILSRSSVAGAQQFRAPYDALANEVLTDTGGQPARVWIISQGDGGTDYYTLRYCLRPCETAGWHLKDEGGPAEGHRILTAEEWQAQLKDAYDYVLIYKLDETFPYAYISCFADETPDSIREQAVYKVNKDTGLLEALHRPEEPGEE